MRFGNRSVLVVSLIVGACSPGVASARAEIDAAAASDRTNVLARLVHAAMSHAIALDDARATVAAHPDDWRALRLLEFALRGTPEAAQVAARICVMSARTAPGCNVRHVASATPEN